MSIFVFLMTYQTFIDSFSKVNDFPLPGRVAQLQAAPLNRQQHIPFKEDDLKTAKKAAVLLYCYPKQDVMQLSLIKRTDYKGVHSGQISFPGGKPEKEDESLQTTALRECHEELGAPLDHQKALFPLTPVYIPPSNFLVSPFITYDDFYPNFQLDSREVASHIELPLFKLLKLRIEQRSLDPETYPNVLVPCFCYEGHLIWGATAMILSEFKVFLASLSSN
ncbi:MAG: CoA pyrophosphatase [Flavobacteriaceae bacterium]